MSRSKTIETQVRQVAESIAAAAGVEVYDLVYRRSGPRFKLQVFLSRPEGAVSLDDCEAVSRQLSRELDVLDLIPQAYDLEVSSPGLERSLREPWHWRRAVGETVRIKWREESGRASTALARLDDVRESDGTVALEDEHGETFVLSLDAVIQARVHFEW
jgi:ribosome maturation factor RimP